MSPALLSLQITQAEAQKALAALRKKKTTRINRFSQTPSKRSVREDAFANNPLLGRLRREARAFLDFGQESDLSKIAVEKAFLYELGAKSMGRTPLAREAAEQLFERDRASTAIMASVDPRLKKRSAEVVNLARDEARLEQVEQNAQGWVVDATRSKTPGRRL